VGVESKGGDNAARRTGKILVACEEVLSADGNTTILMAAKSKKEPLLMNRWKRWLPGCRS
jgi:hypothetical protein